MKCDVDIRKEVRCRQGDRHSSCFLFGYGIIFLILCLSFVFRIWARRSDTVFQGICESMAKELTALEPFARKIWIVVETARKDSRVDCWVYFC